VRDLAVLCAGVYFFLRLGLAWLGLVVGLGLGLIIPTCRRYPLSRVVVVVVVVVVDVVVDIDAQAACDSSDTW